MNDIKQSGHNSAQKVQSVISDDLFPEVQHISDVKQVLELAKDLAQNISQEQLRAIILLKELGNNKYLHAKSPYLDLIKSILEPYKQAVANPSYFLDVIEELIPKQPKPIVFAPNGKMVGGGR